MTGLEVHEYYMIEGETLNIYISKVDTTGCIPTTKNNNNISATKQLISSYINYHLEEKTQPRNKYINIHIFARSQPQYLFTKSSKNPNKHVLKDIDLLKWWKRVLEQTFLITTNNIHNIKKWYYIPGEFKKDDNEYDWIYGYPYDNESNANDVIPKFDDDAKTRWLNHLGNNDDDDHINVKEFWEMISIGNEFSGGKIAGFFWVNIEREKGKNLKDEEYESIVLENLKKNVGGIMFDEQEFIAILQKFFNLEFYNEEIAFKNSKYWSKKFDDFCIQKGINDGVLEFMVGQPQNGLEISSEGISQDSTQEGGSQINKRKSIVIDNDNSPNSVESNGPLKKVNVLSPSLIKRVKK